MDQLTSSYDFALPPDLIAQYPAAVRDASRLLVVGRNGLEHRIFRDLPSLLRAGDLLVLNETRVIAARIFGTRMLREGTGGRVEIVLLHPAESMRYDPAATRWIALARPARRLRTGERIAFGGYGSGTVVRELDEGMREVAFDLDRPFDAFLASAGRLPLPPYIHNDSDEAQERYQTVFARDPGSIAAPTASLHFTPEVLLALERAGVEIARLTLDVGLGTFRPMKSERLDGHTMHAERFAIGIEVADAIARARGEGRRIVAAGTTVVRALEGSAREHGRVVAGEQRTDIFIKPGFAFAVVDAMITNFHLPQSTLLVLVSAFAGRERIVNAYRTAIEQRYRFFSFGDAMLLTRDS
ncbi:MAG: tRNA preQ1(34) S-adenosylmethionine ribosyltransferase-isomerase QueA [Vulcanimicrobiaceae bacterium]